MRNGRLLWGSVVVLVLVVLLGLWLSQRADTARAPEKLSNTPAEARGRSRAAPASREWPRQPLRPMPQAQVVPTDASFGAFAGRVISATTGQGISGAELTFAPEGGGASSVRSGPDGAFAFTPSEAGPWQLASVLADPYRPFGPEWGLSPFVLTASPGQRLEGIVVALTPRVIVEGRVEGPDGVVIEGATVSVIPEAGSGLGLFPAEAPRLTTDARSFRLDATEGMQVEVRHPGFRPAVATVTPEVLLAKKLVVRLESSDAKDAAQDRARVLAGRVVDEAGEPIADVSVRVASADSAYPVRHGVGGLATTDAAGRFRVGALEDGIWDVTASVAAHHQGHVSASLRDVRSGREDLRLVLRISGEAQGVTLVGTVRAPDGRPVPSFALSVEERDGPLRRRPFKTLQVGDPGGQYQVTGLLPGAYAVQVAAVGLAPAEALFEIQEGAEGPLRVDLQLRTGARLEGRVTDAETRAPLQGARVAVEGMSAQGELSVRFDTLSDADGRFALEGLAEGELSLHVLAEGHHSRIIGGLQVGPGAPASVEIALRPTAEGEDPRLELMGIGAELAAREDALVLGRILPGGGAAEAGLAPGDALLGIDGQAVVDLGFVGSVQRIRGLENTVVVLDVRRAGQEAVHPVPVFRRRLSL